MALDKREVWVAGTLTNEKAIHDVVALINCLR